MSSTTFWLKKAVWEPTIERLQDDSRYSHALLGGAVRHVRERKGLSVRELAQAAGISHSQVLRFESGKFDCMVGSFVKMCAALAVPPGWVLDLLVGAEPARFHHAIKGDPGFAVLLESLQIDGKVGESMLFPLSSACALASILARVSSPVRRAAFHYYPNHDWRDRFRSFATRLENPDEATDRAAILAALHDKPVATLQRLGLMSRVTLEQRRDDLKLPNAHRRPTSFGSELHNLNFAEAGVLLGFIEPHSNLGKDKLDATAGGDSVAAMESSPTWPQLRKKIVEATSERGAKAALAVELKVSKQVLNNWLNDREQGAPDAETTLKLLAMFWKPAK